MGYSLTACLNNVEDMILLQLYLDTGHTAGAKKLFPGLAGLAGPAGFACWTSFHTFICTKWKVKGRIRESTGGKGRVIKDGSLVYKLSTVCSVVTSCLGQIWQ
ncbi:hypothetical protein PoB_000314400 [Plakobranchus ocellatus]|uniref:Uncharacterized protein n=1 Tax=Plakobranchus ocellatus TaxID=259542 RepID=A0AAV3Y335_9GAST|nr:hypothetical protein PoB_000314400 [Plakobranchus ocellatus]